MKPGGSFKWLSQNVTIENKLMENRITKVILTSNDIESICIRRLRVLQIVVGFFLGKKKKLETEGKTGFFFIRRLKEDCDY